MGRARLQTQTHSRLSHLLRCPPLKRALSRLWLSLMSSPSSPVLQRLHRLDSSSPDFQDQLCNELYGREYMQCEQNLEGDDLVWFIDYLDKVRRRIALPHPPLKPE